MLEETVKVLKLEIGKLVLTNGGILVFRHSKSLTPDDQIELTKFIENYCGVKVGILFMGDDVSLEVLKKGDA